MHVNVNGVRLFFDSEGPLYQVEGGALRKRPTLLILHGGPGIDHSPYREFGQRLADAFHVVYLDHRASGRSEAGDREQWTLDTWADDVHQFCELLGLEKPFVLGHSFGGYVAQAYASRYPDHAAGLLLVGTAPRFVLSRCLSVFRELAGNARAEIAARFFAKPLENFQEYLAECFPFYSNGPASPELLARMIVRVDVADHFVGGEMQRFDLRDALGRIRCPVLVLSGGQDVIATVEDIEDLRRGLSPGVGQFHHFPKSGHEILRDEALNAAAAIREFCLTEKE